MRRIHEDRQASILTLFGKTRLLPSRRRVLGSLREDTGQSLIEYVLVLPMIFMLVLNLVNFGGFFYAWITVANAARAGADYAVLGKSSPGILAPATGAKVTSMITEDIYSLPNSASLSVNVCQNNNGVITILAGTCSSIPTDVEPGKYVLTSVDVSYTYNPLIPGPFSFPRLGIFLSIPPTTVRRIALVRTIQ